MPEDNTNGSNTGASPQSSSGMSNASDITPPLDNAPLNSPATADSSHSSGILAQLKPLTAEERQEKMKALRARQNAAVAATPKVNENEPTTPVETTITTPQAKPSETAVAPRANMVEQAVRFLRAPNVQSAPISKKLEFLRNKGLTEAEIDTALQDASNTNEKTTAVPIQAPANQAAPAIPPRIDYTNSMPPNYVAYQPAPPPPPSMTQQQFWRGIAVGTAIAAGVSAGSVALLKHYLGPVWTTRVEMRQKDLQDRTSALASLCEALDSTKSTLDNLTSTLGTLEAPRIPKECDLLDETQGKLMKDVEQLREQAIGTAFTATDTKILQLHRDCKQEIRSIKGMMLNRRNFPSPVNSPLMATSK
ncbi:peroxisomal membrane anchor protein conserved region-domain-containing protein [Syncephalis plumigaleata]|nr:peroxisomal membrane anchor protein conserved region-domain-containing protein [Syncephalis plumigaleata]